MGRTAVSHQRDVELHSRLARFLNQARPSHVWVMNPGKPGCKMCPRDSLFHQDRANHLYIIQEAP